jgi:uncharacterized protein with GYD domain
MPTYITLMRYTAKGAAEFKGGPQRLDQAKEQAKRLGGEFKAFFLTMGRFDAVLISEAPNDEVYAAGLLAAAQMGYVQTETMRAFPEDEYKKIVASVP